MAGSRTPAAATPALDGLIAESLANATLLGAALSAPRQADPSVARRLTIDPVTQKDGPRYRIRRHFERRTVDEILRPEATASLLSAALGRVYRQAILHLPDADWQVLAGSKGEPRLLRRPPTRSPAGASSATQDRVKQRLLPEGVPVDFLVALGVQTAGGKVRASRQDKFRQVNRFLELVNDVLGGLPADRPLRVVDFGSGRSYLTFALHHLLTAVHGRTIDLVGLDLKEDVVRECRALAERLGCAGLRFEVGDIAAYPLDGADLVVSLHACDTATDAALHRAVCAKAPVILAVPCCQHELAGQIENSALRPLLRHGTLRERFAAEVTDAARARLLELVGYRVQVVEFVPLEHTPKNILLRATRTTRPRRDTDQLAAEYRAFADELGIAPTLERLLGEQLPPAARPGGEQS